MKRNTIYLRLLCVLTVSALYLTQLYLPLKAQAQAPQAKNLVDPKEIEALLDPLFKAEMEKQHVPGAVVSVVKDGKVFFTKGYGVADIETKAPVVPDKTIFRIGSITKVFTALAVMQLFDRKRIRLTDDVNTYLMGVKVPNTFPQPITFHDLLTHSSGLDEISPGRRTSDENSVIPLGDFLRTRIVRRAPPGEAISYSTYNAALAALAVEQITRTPFKKYLQQNIFEPLGMSHTSITAVKQEYKQDLASGYEYISNENQKLPFQWFHTYPASDINSTATDMARFMIANLQGGVIDGKRILSAKAAHEMQATHFRMHPKIPGWAYGFYEWDENNLHLIGHSGTMDDGYSAMMAMVPEKQLGIFVACNTESCGGQLGEQVRWEILGHYFPLQERSEVPQSKNPSPAELKKFEGKYRSIIYCHTCPPNTSYVTAPLEVKVTEDGMLSLWGGKWKQIEPMLFVRADGRLAGRVFLGFKENKPGEVAYMFQTTYQVFEKVSP